MSDIIYTIGHSTHAIEVFVELLRKHGIQLVADVRSFPSSRRWPQFNQTPFRESLEASGIQYLWFKALGGRRRSSKKDSQHTAWQVDAFRSYADYADSADFVAGLEDLQQIARAQRVAFMCSEGLWWRCHRRIIADHLTIAGWTVNHILPTGQLAEHALPDFARVVDGRLIYDGNQAPLKLERPS
ncbi:MAG TPA: DUF488 domain-containing protein [Candidatus Binataceae bacterium]|jgi:uncharacterized protein (DUF488 family)|nr:DUF488 domain-containing protein [Candidatus Binataceae bacterium]